MDTVLLEALPGSKVDVAGHLADFNQSPHVAALIDLVL